MPRTRALSIEEKGIRAVMGYERSQGRKPRDVRGQKGLGYDIASGRRKIEVKAVAQKAPDLMKLNEPGFRLLQTDKNFWVYVVQVSGKRPKIYRFNRDRALEAYRPSVHHGLKFTSEMLKSRR